MTAAQVRERVYVICRRSVALLNAGRGVSRGYRDVSAMAGLVNPAAFVERRGRWHLAARG